MLNDFLYFIEKGLFQIYSEQNDKRAPLRFKKEDDFIITLKDIYRDPKMKFMGVEALEDGVLWGLPGNLIMELYKSHPEFMEHSRIIVQNDWIAVELSGYCSRTDGGSANYTMLCQHWPQLLNRVPIPYLADYTGIPEKIFRHLHSSKIRLNAGTERRRLE